MSETLPDRRCQVKVHEELIQNWLMMPDDVNIDSVTWDSVHHLVVFTLRGIGPRTADHAVPLTVCPTITKQPSVVADWERCNIELAELASLTVSAPVSDELIEPALLGGPPYA